MAMVDLGQQLGLAICWPEEGQDMNGGRLGIYGGKMTQRHGGQRRRTMNGRRTDETDRPKRLGVRVPRLAERS